MAGLKEHIFLIGFMGCGKSTNAECLAEMTGARQVEMDQMIVENEGMAIADIFEEKGEAYFRELETDLIKSFAGVEPAVISCGGGAVLKEENVRLMKESGKIVLLTAEPETIYERVKDSTERPVLNGNMNVGYIEELMEKRRSKYEAAADVKVATDGKTAEERNTGNTDFAKAEETIKKALDEMHMEENEKFIEMFLPAYTKTLDEISK